MALEFPKKSAAFECSPETPAQSVGEKGVHPDVQIHLVYSQGKLQACMSCSRFVTRHETLLLEPAVDGEPSARLWCSSAGNN